MPIVDRIKLPSGNVYELRDADAQSKLNNVYTKSETYSRAEVQEVVADAMKGGYVAVTALPAASDGTMGHIYLIPGTTVSGDNTRIEYVTIRSGSEGAYTYAWEELGTTELNLDNLDLVKGGGDMVLGESTTFSVSKPSVNITGTTSDNFIKSYPGTTGKLVTTTVPNVTGNSDVSIPNVTGNSDVSIPNVTSVGSASTWGFSMGTGNESTTLIISGGNGSAPTLGSALSASKVTLGTALSASKVTLGTAKTVATGEVTSNGSGSSVMTGLGSATTASAVTNVGSASLGSTPTITVGTNDKVKVAKYDDLDLQKP